MLLSAAGAALWIALAVIFAECGLLVGFFLPGDTLLFTVGLFVSQGLIDHPIWWVCVVLTVGAVLGNVLGYEIGRAVGPPVFERRQGRLINKQQVARTRDFFDRFGAVAIILARFVPVVRTFITVTAGVARMDRRLYLTYSTIGAVIWVWSITLLAWRLGAYQFVQDVVQPHLDLIIVGAVVISILPVLLHLLLSRHRAKRRGGATPHTPAASTSESAAAMDSGRAEQQHRGDNEATPTAHRASVPRSP